MDPLTRSERNKKWCKNYREKNREEYRKRDAERKRMARMTGKFTKPAVYELKKKAERLRLRIYRQRQKLELINTKQTNTSTEVSLQEEGRESSSFSNKQSKYRSLSKVEKALPSSPNKRREVVGALAKKYKLRINLLPQKPGPKAQILKEKEIDWLTEFLDRGDISYITPSRKDHVDTGIIDGVKQYVQKRYLRWNLRDLFDILNGHNTFQKLMNDHFNKNSDMKFPLVVFMNSSEVKSSIYSTRKYHKRHAYVGYART